jgi:predicted DNA-binding mobile mystery protein A
MRTHVFLVEWTMRKHGTSARSTMQSGAAQRRALHALDDKLLALGSPAAFTPPRRGYIRAIRDALNMTTSDLASRMGIARQSVTAMEASEQADSIRLATLRRAAAAMDCTLVYAIVPNQSLTATLEHQARTVMAKNQAISEHTMRLEGEPIADDSADLATVIATKGLWSADVPH